VSQSGLYLRILAALLLASLPILLAMAAAVLLDPPWLGNFSEGALLLSVAIAAVVWAGMLAVPYSRSLLLDLRSIVRMAERGRYAADRGGTLADDLGGEHERLVAALDERNRQMSELAARVRAARITEDARLVAGHVVRTVRTVTRDPTWVLAIFEGSMPEILPPGCYGWNVEVDSPAPLQDLHRWAAVTGNDQRQDAVARRIDGPWGAFIVVDVHADDRLRALLIAPWEGRPEPTPAERTLFSLLGQHAATSIDHALIYAETRRQAQELNRLTTLQGDFLRSVSHDLQTPLTSIAALAAELGDRADCSVRDAEDLGTIQHQAERLRRMVGQLLVASRLEIGTVQPRIEIFRPEPLVLRTWEALRQTDRQFIVNVRGIHHLAVGDPDRVEQVLWALLDNAVKYSPPASPIHVEITGRPEEDGTLLSEITIADSGIGMEEEIAARAFDQFFRSHDARSLVPNGSGIGLYAARGLLRLMGGDITVQSIFGEGSRFRLTLPGERVSED
jgi:signal transduction histidine kinase